jgi:hypothetical protein
MGEKCQTRPSGDLRPMSALPSIAIIGRTFPHGRFVPLASFCSLPAERLLRPSRTTVLFTVAAYVLYDWTCV